VRLVSLVAPALSYVKSPLRAGEGAGAAARVFEQFHQIDNSNTKAKGGPAQASLSQKRASRCTAVASGSSQRWVRARPSRWRFPLTRPRQRCRMTKRILIVEDQEDLRGVLRDLLSGFGYEVAEAADGRDGVVKAQSEPPISF
jgi:PleD family two-component response regulator